jgi:hypothetical protein
MSDAQAVKLNNQREMSIRYGSEHRGQAIAKCGWTF